MTKVLVVRLQIDEVRDQKVSGEYPGPDPELRGRGRDQPCAVDDVRGEGQLREAIAKRIAFSAAVRR